MTGESTSRSRRRKAPSAGGLTTSSWRTAERAACVAMCSTSAWKDTPVSHGSFLWHFRAPLFSKLWKATPMASMLLFYNEDRAADSLVPQSGTDEWAYFSSPVPEDVDGDDWEAMPGDALPCGWRGVRSRAAQRRNVHHQHAAGAEVRLRPRLPDRRRRSPRVAHGWHGHEHRYRRRRRPRLEVRRRHRRMGWPHAPAQLRSRARRSGSLHSRWVARPTRPSAPGSWCARASKRLGPAGDAVRAQVAEAINIQKARQFKRMGGTLGYRYSSSPVIVRDGIDEPEPTFEDYIPSASPGNRAPHAWLSDGTSLYDHFGQGFTLLTLGDFDSAGMLSAAAVRGIPLEVFEPGETDRAGATRVVRRERGHRPHGSPRCLAGRCRPHRSGRCPERHRRVGFPLEPGCFRWQRTRCDPRGAEGDGGSATSGSTSVTSRRCASSTATSSA